MKKQLILRAAIVIGVLIALRMAYDAVYNGPVPYIPLYPGSMLVEDNEIWAAVPGLEARIGMAIPPGEGSATLWQDDDYAEYGKLLEQHGWVSGRVTAQCSFHKFVYGNPLLGSSFTLSITPESMGDRTYRLWALVTRGHGTGPQYCADM